MSKGFLMSLRFYADEPARRTRQIVADVLLGLWCLLALWAGHLVHDRALVAQSGARKLEAGSSSLAQDMKDAAESVAKIPFVGRDSRAPFDRAAQTGQDLSASGHDLATGLGRFAVLLGVLTALVPILLALVPWGLTRLRYAVRAGRLVRLRRIPGGRRLLALEALTSADPRRLAAIDDDPARAWQDDDADTTRDLARLVLATHGLSVPDAFRLEGVAPTARPAAREVDDEAARDA